MTEKESSSGVEEEGEYEHEHEHKHSAAVGVGNLPESAEMISKDTHNDDDDDDVNKNENDLLSVGSENESSVKPSSMPVPMPMNGIKTNANKMASGGGSTEQGQGQERKHDNGGDTDNTDEGNCTTDEGEGKEDNGGGDGGDDSGSLEIPASPTSTNLSEGENENDDPESSLKKKENNESSSIASTACEGEGNDHTNENGEGEMKNDHEEEEEKIIKDATSTAAATDADTTSTTVTKTGTGTMEEAEAVGHGGNNTTDTCKSESKNDPAVESTSTTTTTTTISVKNDNDPSVTATTSTPNPDTNPSSSIVTDDHPQIQKAGEVRGENEEEEEEDEHMQSSDTSSSSSSSSSDEDEKIATQMAAVALAATAKTSDLKSPAAAANYAKDISKDISSSSSSSPPTNASPTPTPTIVPIPPSSNNNQQQQQQHQRNQSKKKRNRRIPVHPILVQVMIAQHCQKMQDARSCDESYDDDEYDDKDTKVKGSGDGDDDIGIDQSRSDITFGHASYRSMKTNATNNTAPSISSSCALAPSNTSEFAYASYDEEDDDGMASDFASIMQQELANGQNVNFLKHLLVLNNHTCIVSEDDMALEKQPSSPSRQNSASGSASASVDSTTNSADHCLQDSVNDPDGMMMAYTPEEREIATNAALLAMDTLQQMDKSYNYLLDLIHIHQQGNRASANTIGGSTNHSSSAGVGGIGGGGDHETDASDMDGGFSKYDPNSSFSNLSFESTRVIPDLLPLCTSAEGDATASFFRACAPILTEAVVADSSITTSAAAATGAVVVDGNGKGGEDEKATTTTIGSSNSTLANVPENSTTTDENQKMPSSPSPKTPNSIASKRDNKQQALTSPQTTSARTVASTVMSSLFRRSRNKQLQQQQQQKKNDDETSSVSSGGTSISSLTMNTLESIQQNVNDATTNTNNITNQEKSTRIGVDYNVTIIREMLGLTVENVLERTVVRTVLPNGAAKKAGTKVGSLVVKVGSVETANLTHFETIDELRQSQRPLKLVLRRISKDALRGAREEMGRLIRGGGFGMVSLSMDGHHLNQMDEFTDDESQSRDDSTTIHMDLYIKLIHDRWIEGTKRKLHANAMTKRDEALSKAGAKLAWILSLLVMGLEREAIQSRSFGDDDFSFASHLSDFDHTVKDYADAAKSVSKILYDYARKHFEREPKTSKTTYQPPPMNPLHMKRKKQIAPPPHIQNKQRQAIPGASKRSIQNKANVNGSSSLSPADNALLQIGDVLHRARSFLADPNSPPAALLRGEVIALLCDILDLDNEMTLSEEESASSSADRKPGLINDLGSAGSLLKLIVLNCSMMRSSGCHDNDEDSHAAHAGNRFLAVVHRLAASRSISARVTACSLGPVLWGHLDFPHQLQLRGVITRALHDVEVIVRKSTATVLHEIAELVFDSRAVPWLVLMCERAMTDPEPQLRAAAMTLTFHLAEHLPNAFFGDASEGSRSIRGLPSRSDPTFAEVYLLQCKLLPVATRLAEDGTASVRLAVAAQCDRLAKAMGEHWHSVIIDLLQALLGDKDSRVRGEAAMCIPRLAESVLSIIVTPSTVGNENMFVLESLLPVALKLQKDPAPDVRMCLAAASGELLSFLVWLQHLAEESSPQEEPSNISDNSTRQKRYIDDTLIPLLQNLLQDSDPEVTSAALRAVTNASRGHGRDRSENRNQRTYNEDDSVSLSSQSHHSYLLEKRDPVFRPVLSEAQVLRLVPTLSELSSSTQWRVRQSAVEIVPALLGCTHKLETRSEIAQLCVKLMGDPVDAVRKSAAECLCLGGSNLGSNPTDESTEAYEWLAAVVMPHLGACKDSANSKQRLLCLKMIEMVLVDVLRPNSSSSNWKTSSSVLSLPRKTLEMASDLCNDKVVNVRLNVGRTFGNIMNSCTLSVEDLKYIISVLEGQVGEEQSRPDSGDGDVLYFAKKSISLAKERLDQCCDPSDGTS